MDLLCCANFLLSRAMRRAVAFGSLDKALDTADGPKPRQRAAGKGPPQTYYEAWRIAVNIAQQPHGARKQEIGAA